MTDSNPFGNRGKSWGQGLAIPCVKNYELDPVERGSVIVKRNAGGWRDRFQGLFNTEEASKVARVYGS